MAVSLALEILEVLARSDSARRVTDLADELGTSKTRVFRYLRTLVALGYVVQEADTERYAAGMRLALLGSRAAERFDLLAASRPMLRRVRDATTHSVVLSTIVNNAMLTVDKADGASVISFGPVIGAQLGLHSSAQGKLVLAFSAVSFVEGVLSRPLLSVTPRTIVDVEELRRELDLIRVRGWATAPSETLTGLNALACPIFDSAGHIAATIAMLASIDILPPVPDQRSLELLREAAREIALNAYGSSNVPADAMAWRSARIGR